MNYSHVDSRSTRRARQVRDMCMRHDWRWRNDVYWCGVCETDRVFYKLLWRERVNTLWVRKTGPFFYFGRTLANNVRFLAERYYVTLRSACGMRRPSVCLSSVCRLSVTLLHPKQRTELFGNILHRLIAQGLADSKMVQDRAFVITAGRYKVVYDLSIGAIFNNISDL